MKSFSTICCALAFLTILNVANASSMCTPMDPTEKATYEAIYGREFMGCTISTSEGMTAMSRMNWLTPAGGQPLLEMDGSAGSEMSGMTKVKGGSMAMAAMKVAGAALARPGYLTVSPECAASLEPDFIYSVLAKSPSPKVFNAILEEACANGSVRNLKTSMRQLDPLAPGAAALAEAILCLLASVVSLFFPIFDASLIAALKIIVADLFGLLLPTVSATARTIETIARV